MSLETRSNSALMKRAEQLKRWQDSDTFREPSEPKRKTRKVGFSDGCVFLAACAAGDKGEVKVLLGRGADIDTANVDGLTALHQACIDDNLEMVEFLVEHGADVNRGDNEGWTPLHATASCGFLSIARYLLDHSANVAAVNNDGELAIDISESDEMEDLLQKEINNQKVNCEEARNMEESSMMNDAKQWLNSGVFGDLPHQKTGATALHVAAAKGYIRVINLLIQAGGQVNSQDYDGWTPLHAAAHWAQREACELLADNYVNMEIKNCVGQTAFDVADPDVLRLLEELRKKQANMQRDRPEITALINRIPTQPPPANKRRSSITRLSYDDKIQRSKEATVKETIQEEKVVPDSLTEGSDTGKSRSSDQPGLIITDESGKEAVPGFVPPHPDTGQGKEDTAASWRRPASLRARPTASVASTGKLSPGGDDGTVVRRAHSFGSDDKFYAKLAELRQRIRANSMPVLNQERDEDEEAEGEGGVGGRLTASSFHPRLHYQKQPTNTTHTLPFTHRRVNHPATLSDIHTHSLPRPPKSRLPSLTESYEATSPSDTQPGDSGGGTESPAVSTGGDKPPLPPKPSAPPPQPATTTTTNNTTYSTFISARPFRTSDSALPSARVSEFAASLTAKASDEAAAMPMVVAAVHHRSSSAMPVQAAVAESEDSSLSSVVGSSPPSSLTNTESEHETSDVPGRRVSDDSISKQSPDFSLRLKSDKSLTTQVRRSFVPPVRDEEHEIQRKAHAKRVRETRRSTQGVTLEDLKSAEQLVKKKQQQENAQRTTELQQLASTNPPAPSTPSPNYTATTTVSTSATLVTTGSTDAEKQQERRPSWRLRMETGDKTRFTLEDSRSASLSRPNTHSPERRISRNLPSSSSSSYHTPTLPTISQETVLTSPPAAAGASTQPSFTLSPPPSSSSHTTTTTTTTAKDTESNVGGSQPGTPTQLAISRKKKPKRRSTGVVNIDMDDFNDTEDSEGENVPTGSSLQPTDKKKSQNGDIDYKKLWEESQAENTRLRLEMSTIRSDLDTARRQLETAIEASTKNAVSDTEKREKKMLEKKLAEMEEELKTLEQLKSDNQRLRDENGALIRVISKLSK